MLDGTFFYVDRAEGRAYCDQCVPSCGGRAAGWAPPWETDPRGTRWKLVRSGDAQVLEHGGGGSRARAWPFVLRCCECDAVQAPAR